jgi:hypothetical protein
LTLKFSADLQSFPQGEVVAKDSAAVACARAVREFSYFDDMDVPKVNIGRDMLFGTTFNVPVVNIGDVHKGGYVFDISGVLSTRQPLYLSSQNQSIGTGLIANTMDTDISTNSVFDATAFNCLEVGGYADWRLPTIEELQKMHTHLYMKGIGDFKEDGIYWSSTTYNYAGAFNFSGLLTLKFSADLQSFPQGEVVAKDSAAVACARAVREFYR